MAAVHQDVKESDMPSIAEIRAAIPAHCFDRSLAKSLVSVLRDGVIIAALGVVGWFLPINFSLFSLIAWPLYIFWQGSALTGWWVLAHECGHHAFSNSATVDNIIGFMLHTILFVPYFSWQYSHAKHHAKTNHLIDGETHTPSTRKGFSAMEPVFRALGEDGFAALQVLGHLVLGWPLYLLFNQTGSRRLHTGERIPKGEVLDHFRPWSKLFPANWQMRVAASTAGLFVVLSILVAVAQKIGYARVGLMYWGPYMVTNGWLVLYTWLQHTDVGVAHFGDSDWTWLKGAALGTIDRPYGIFDWMHHHIGSTHVAHHLFSRLPHYHAVEATEHVKKILGDKYNYRGDHFVTSMWRVAKNCHFVESVEGTQTYKHLEAKRTSETVSPAAARAPGA